jgi:hypothetical protein
MNEWRIGISSWIIQDGNYGDFRRQERAEFALEFYPGSWHPNSTSEKPALWIGGSNYKVNAEVIHVSKRCFVIDFGISAYQQAEPPKAIRRGRWLTAEIYLGIDPFFYFEDLTHVKGMPPLIYNWHIHKISVETAPFIESVDAHGRRMMVRDGSKSAFREIQQTDAWTEDNGNAEYVLDCTLMNCPPKRNRG